MKLGEVIPKYREYRQVLVDQTRNLAKQRDEAKKKFELMEEDFDLDDLFF